MDLASPMFFIPALRCFLSISSHLIASLHNNKGQVAIKESECGMASKPTSSSSRAPANSTGSHVRRNLFHHHLSRRPTSASTSTSATTMQDTLQDNSSEIVIRDQNGDPSVQIPLLPPLEDDQAQDEETTEKESKSDGFYINRLD